MPINSQNVISADFRTILTCISNALSDGNEFVLVSLGAHLEVVTLDVSALSLPVSQVNTQTMTSAGCHRIKVVVTCT